MARATSFYYFLALEWIAIAYRIFHFIFCILRVYIYYITSHITHRECSFLYFARHRAIAIKRVIKYVRHKKLNELSDTSYYLYKLCWEQGRLANRILLPKNIELYFTLTFRPKNIHPIG